MKINKTEQIKWKKRKVKPNSLLFACCFSFCSIVAEYLWFIGFREQVFSIQLFILWILFQKFHKRKIAVETPFTFQFLLYCIQITLLRGKWGDSIGHLFLLIWEQCTNKLQIFIVFNSNWTHKLNYFSLNWGEHPNLQKSSDLVHGFSCTVDRICVVHSQQVSISFLLLFRLSIRRNSL